MRHTFVVSHGIRVEIQQSKIEAGAVLLSINYPSGDRFGCATIPAATAALIAQALEIEAAAAEAEAAVSENVAKCCEAPRADCMGMLVPSIGDGCRALREEEGRAAVAGVFGQWVDVNGVPPGRAVPVVSESELNAQFFARRASDCGAETVGA